MEAQSSSSTATPGTPRSTASDEDGIASSCLVTSDSKHRVIPQDVLHDRESCVEMPAAATCTLPSDCRTVLRLDDALRAQSAEQHLVIAESAQSFQAQWLFPCNNSSATCLTGTATAYEDNSFLYASE